MHWGAFPATPLEKDSKPDTSVNTILGVTNSSDISCNNEHLHR